MKYRNKPVRSDGTLFHSRGELGRWRELQLLERGGAIHNLKRQVKLPINVNGQHIAYYIADFTYRDGQLDVIEDFKSPATAKLPDFRLKWKLVAALYPDHDLRLTSKAPLTVSIPHEGKVS